MPLPVPLLAAARPLFMRAPAHTIRAGRVTKVRPTLSFELALTRVAERIGYAQAAQLVGKSSSTLRSWGDPDCGPAAGRALSLDHAVALSVAFRMAGGEGSPLLDCLETQIETEFLAEEAEACLAQAAGLHAKETGEAVSWAVAASLPQAGRGVLDRAERACERSVNAGLKMLAAIRGRLGRPLRFRKLRGPEVPPPVEA